MVLTRSPRDFAARCISSSPCPTARRAEKNFRNQDRRSLFGCDRGLREARRHVDQSGNYRELYAIARAWLRALGRSLEGGSTRRRTLRGRSRRRIFWRIDVSSRYRRVEDRAGGARATFACEKVRVARHPMAHAALATLRRHRDFTEPLPALAQARGRIAAQIRRLIFWWERTARSSEFRSSARPAVAPPYYTIFEIVGHAHPCQRQGN